MKFICISASNTKNIGINSTSTKACNLVKDLMEANYQDTVTEVVPLRDYDLKNCFFCGDCVKTGKCAYDSEFNRLQEKISTADGIFIVIPHYSPVPSKLLMVFEKLNEIFYGGWLNNPEYQSALNHKPVALIGHGGMAEEESVLKYYHDHLITPVADTLRSLSYDVIKYKEEFPNGAVFGLKDVKCIKPVENAVFPAIIQDWPVIEERVTPLIENMFRKLKK